MKPTQTSVYKLSLFTEIPQNFEGNLFSFVKEDGVHHIDISFDDPFTVVKQAVIQALGLPCGLIIKAPDFFSELFVSVYEQLSLVFLEIKDLMRSHVQAFVDKSHMALGKVEFLEETNTPVILMGGGASLLQDIKKVIQCKDHCILIAAYSVLPLLETYGLTADIAFAIDPQQQGHPSKNAQLLLISPKTSSGILEGFSSVAFFPETYCAFSGFLFKNSPHPPVYGYTVMDTALKFLVQTGFKTIYLTGIDLEEQDGLYAKGDQAGFKPDFKKAKEHIDLLKEQYKGIDSLAAMADEISNEKTFHFQIQPIDSTSLINSFQQSLRKLQALDFSTLGLSDMFSLEIEPFYQVVLDPLYEKWSLLQLDSTDRRTFFNKVMPYYA